MAFKLLWAFDALIALVFVVFFIIGLADGSVSSFNGGLWMAILVVLAGVLWGGGALRGAGHQRLAMALLVLLAIPGVVACLFFLVLLVFPAHWQ